jgi:hypothetical protein
LMEMGGWARIKVTYSTINNGWRWEWKAVGGWRGWGVMKTLRVDDGNRADDDALASSPVPRLPMQWRWQRRRGPSFTSTMATGQTMMLRHHHLSLACPRDDDGSGSGGRLCVSTTATGQVMMPTCRRRTDHCRRTIHCHCHCHRCRRRLRCRCHRHCCCRCRCIDVVPSVAVALPSHCHSPLSPSAVVPSGRSGLARPAAALATPLPQSLHCAALATAALPPPLPC